MRERPETFDNRHGVSNKLSIAYVICQKNNTPESWTLLGHRFLGVYFLRLRVVLMRSVFLCFDMARSALAFPFA